MTSVHQRVTVTDRQVAVVLEPPATHSMLEGRAECFPMRNLILYPLPLFTWRVERGYSARLPDGWHYSVGIWMPGVESDATAGSAMIRVEILREGLIAEWRRFTGGGALTIVDGELCDASPAELCVLESALRVLINEAVVAFIQLRVFDDAEPALADMTREREAHTATRDDLERERVRLAACGVAALGYATGTNDCQPGDYGHSSSFDDVKRLLAEARALRAVRDVAREVANCWGTDAPENVLRLRAALDAEPE